MRSLNTTCFLALLCLLAPATASAPLKQFGKVLGSANTQLNVLSAQGYDSHSFGKLSNLLARLFGTMEKISEPHFNEFVQHALAQNEATLAQIIELENVSQSAATVVFTLLNSASAALGSAIAAIGSTLFNYHNEANAKIFELNNNLGQTQGLVDDMRSDIQTLPARQDAIEIDLNDAKTKCEEADELTEKATDPWAVLRIIEAPGIELEASLDPHCAEYTFDFGTWITPTFHGAFAAYPLAVDGDASAGPFYDVNILGHEGPLTRVRICERDGNPILPIPRSIIVQANRY